MIGPKRRSYCGLSIPALPVCRTSDHPPRRSDEVHAVDPSGHHPAAGVGRVGPAVARTSRRRCTPRTRRSTRRPGSPPASRCSRPRRRTTVRVQDGKTLTTDGPFVEIKEALGGYLLLRGRRPRRGDRAGGEDPGGAHGRRDRGAPDRGVVAILEQVFRDQWGRVLAALIGFLGDFDLAEEAAQEAFAIAAERWPRDGVPAQPRRLADHDGAQPGHRPHPPRPHAGREDPPARRAREAWRTTMDDETAFPDERLELIFTCCHPALAIDAQVALTLRTLGGLQHRRDRPRVPRARGDDGAAAGAGEAQDQARPGSRSGCRPTTCCPTGWPRCSRSST